MGLQMFETLQQRLAKVERRLMLALAGLLVVTACLVVSIVAQKAYGQATTKFSVFTGSVGYFIDARTSVTCYILPADSTHSPAISCVH